MKTCAKNVLVRGEKMVMTIDGVAPYGTDRGEVQTVKVITIASMYPMRMRACSATVPCHGCYAPNSSVLEAYMSCGNIDIMDRFLTRWWWRIGSKSKQK